MNVLGVITLGLRLTYLLLENYDYFLTGQNKKRIEFKLNEEDDIIVVTGDNGTGKSSLVMLAITPFPRTERGYGIIEGREGRKVQKFRDDENNCTYEIIHEYTPKKGGSHTCKSYLYRHKDGKRESLNEGGKVNAFRDTVEDIFGVSTDTVEVLSLTCDDFGIVTKSPAQRRDYVKVLINGLEEIDNRKAIVDEKYRDFKKQKKANEVKLENHPDSEKLKKDIKETEGLLKDYKENLKQVNIQLGEINKVDDKKLNNKKEKIKKLKKENENASKLITLIEEEFYNEKSVQFNLNEIENKVDNYDRKIKEIKEELKSKNKDLLKNKKELKSLSDVKKNTEQIKTIKKKIENTDQEVKDIDIDLSREEFRDGINKLQKIMTELELIRDNLSDKKLLKKDIDKDYFDKLLNEKKKIKSDLKDELKDKNDEYHKVNNKGLAFMADKTIPKACDMKCDLKDLYNQAKSDNKAINKLEKEIEKLKEDINEATVEVNKINRDIEWLKKTVQLIDEVKEIEVFLNKDNVFSNLKADSIIDVLKNSTVDKNKKRIEMRVEQIRRYYDYKEYKSKLDSMSEMSNRENKLYEKYKDSLKDIKDKKEELNSKLDDHQKEKSKLKDKIDKINKKSEDDYLLMNMDKETLEKHIKENEESIDEIEKEVKDLEEKIKHLEELKESENKIQANIQSVENRLDDLKSKKSVMEHLEEEYVRLSKEEKISYAVREVLRIHLPIKVMDSFLENVKIYANEFLETSNLPYRVSNFDISDSEFRIEALKNGRVVDDVKKMSKGESALMSLAISFGKQRVMSSLDKYKIISLDEVDSYLKEEKKEIFKDIVLKQKEIFNLDQVFIVTHNENFTKMNNVSHICFDKSNVDPYSNKRIIYHHKLN